MKRKMIILITVIMVQFFLQTMTVSAENRDFSQELFQLVNKQRTEAGLPELIWSEDMQTATDIRASEAAVLFSHTRPDGSSWWTADSTLLYGENLAKGYESADETVQAWMASPAHKAVILDSGFSTGCISIYESNGVLYIAQEFGY